MSVYTYSYDSLHCGYVSDIGYLCPLTYKNDTTVILPFLDIKKKHLQDAVAKLLSSEFHKEIGQDQTAMQYITTNFCSTTDVLFVMHVNETVVGLVTVDRKNFAPVIGHLVVSSEQRRKGYGSRLLDIAERFVKSQGFKSVSLWRSNLDTYLHQFYLNRGYVGDARRLDKDVTVMTKTLPNADADAVKAMEDDDTHAYASVF